VGQVFTNPLPLALLLFAAAPAWWPAAVAALLLRAFAGAATAGLALRDPLVKRLWWAVPVQDIASFVGWVGGFFGNTIVWRGRKYYLRRDGRFELVDHVQ
jgi:ceramide glucosyltransferase